MADKIIVPTLGESIKEATVAKWLKKLGDSVSADEAIVSLETDKVSVDVTSPKSGVLKEILAQEGSIVQVGGLLGSVEVGASVLPVKKEEKKFQRLNKM
jgi:Pyruvate/2-oxoglutarate dehydrogenase complex, dihydrolipoamide acyltransferase (E2) component, and related enzymes